MAPALSFHLAATWLLVGLIWSIQLLVYPQFRRVKTEEFIAFHFAHCLRIGLLVAPLLLVEAGTAVLLLRQGQREPPFLISVGLMPVIWLSTAVFQAPLHVKLMSGFDAEIIRRLTTTNWLRTLAWTARGVLVSYVAVG